jgi:UDP:flavonoid glycosyltransferase YjiC (YdhE family)
MSHPSHQLTVLPIALKLIDKNYQVSFCGPERAVEGENLQKNAINQGINFICFNPSDDLGNVNQKDDSDTSNEFHCFLKNLYDGEIYKKFVQKNRPDLIILDIFYMPLAIVFKYFKIPVILANAQLVDDKDIDVPPIISPILPNGSKESKKIIQKAWQEIRKRKENMQAYFEFIKEISTKYQFDFNKLFYIDKSLVPFGLKLPELVFWDKAFDFNRTDDAKRERYYLGTQIDIDRKENYSNLLQIPRDSKLVYVAFGSKWNIAKTLKVDLVKKIITVAKQLSNLIFVIAVSKYKNEFVNKSTYPKNVIFLDYAPQLYLLSKSSLMITHGGGSIKECIRFGVPMLCYPFDNDQFGNAARVVYHGLGDRGNAGLDNVNTIKEKILKILENQETKQRLNYFQVRAIEAERSTKDVKIIEELIDSIKRTSTN